MWRRCQIADGASPRITPTAQRDEQQHPHPPSQVRGGGEAVARRPRLRAIAMVTMEGTVNLRQPKHLHCRWGPDRNLKATLTQPGPRGRELVGCTTHCCASPRRGRGGGGGGSRQRSPPVLSCSSHDKTALSPRQYIPTASPGSPSRPLSTGGLSTSPEIAHASFLEDEKTPVHLCAQPHTTFSWSSLELGAMYLHMTLVDWPIC